jgi:hypothetical protein
VNRNKATLQVDRNEQSTTLYIEASYKGWTYTLEVLVGLPYERLILQEGATTKIGTSHITQYNWVGSDGLGTENADATTYLVYETGPDPVGDLLNGAQTPAGALPYHLNDDIPVTAGNWVTFYEVSANNPTAIISYGSDLAYIYARDTATGDGKLANPGVGAPTVKLYNNIRLPLVDDLPTLDGYFIGGGNHTTYSPITRGDGWPLGGTSLPPPNGTALATVVTAGTKNPTGYTVTVVYEGDIFKEFDPALEIRENGATVAWGGYNLNAAPSGGKQIDANEGTAKYAYGTTGGFSLDQKTGAHRYVVKHNDSSAWNMTLNPPTVSGPSNRGIWVNPNAVIKTSIVRAPDVVNVQNILKLSPGTNREWVSNVDYTTFGGTTLVGFVSGANFVESYATKPAPADLRLLFDSRVLGATATVNIPAAAFALGSAPAPDQDPYTPVGGSLSTQLTGTWESQIYGEITYTTTSNVAWGSGGPSNNPEFGKKPIEGGTVIGNAWKSVAYRVASPSWGPALPLYTAAPTSDKVTLSWYIVDGHDWGTALPPTDITVGANLPKGSLAVAADVPTPPGTYGPRLSGHSQFTGGYYESFLFPRPDSTLGVGTNGHTGTYGKTLGMIITSSSNKVIFVDNTGAEVPSQFIVGVVQQ